MAIAASEFTKVFLKKDLKNSILWPLLVDQRNTMLFRCKKMHVNIWVWKIYWVKNVLSRSCYLLLHAVWILRLGWSGYFLLHSKYNQSKCDFWCFKYIWQRLLPILPQPSPDVKEWSPVVWEYFLYLPYIDSLSLSLVPTSFLFSCLEATVSKLLKAMTGKRQNSPCRCCVLRWFGIIVNRKLGS